MSSDLSQMVGTSVPTSVSITPAIPIQFDRVKGARWFNAARGNTVLILGQGGIGSWLSLLMCRVGSKIHIWDMDRFENHNMTGQLVRAIDVGKDKVLVAAEICRIFNENAHVMVNGEYALDSYTGKVVMCAFDNMAARKLAFEKWKEYVQKAATITNKRTPPDEFVNQCFFQDGRLKADQLQIFNIPGDRPDLIEKYEKDYLFDDKEVADEDCTFKQTSHCAAMIAGHMVAFYTNWLTNVVSEDPDYTKLPFYYEYVIPFNMTMQKYDNT